MEPTKLVKQFHQEYTKLIADFSIIDEQDPLSQETVKKLLDLLKHWEKIISEGFNNHTVFIENYQERISKAKLKYNSTISSLNAGLNRALKNITNSHIEACKNLKQKIQTSKENNQYAIEQLELDYNYFVSTSEQNLDLLQNDFEDAKKRYDYQKDEAKDSYFEIVKKNNELLDNIRTELLENHNSSLAAFQKEQEELLEQLQLIVLEKTDELDNLIRALENEKNNMKEKYRQESASLNESIKKYSSEKNQIIDNARNQYNKSINDASIEKENKKQIYQNNLQALLKEFVTKITEIEEQASQIRKDFEQLTDEMKRTYYTDVYNKTKVFHQQLENIYAASSNNQLDKYTQHLIQYKNKQYLIDLDLSKKETELKLLTKTQKHAMDLQSSKNNKNFLEIDKNYASKNITIQEQFDNKYYQEKDSVYENDFNYIVKTANLHFAQKANVLKCQSQIRTMLLERNYDGIEANYYKKIETIQNKLNAYKLEIQLTNNLKDILLFHLKEKYYLKLHLEEVNNLLEIEKNKILKEYNMDKYEYNVKNITLSRDYGYKKIDLENQKAEKYKNLKIELEKALLKKNTVSTSFSIKREQLEEKFAKLKAQIRNTHDINTIKEKYLVDLKNADLFYLNQNITVYNNFFDSFKRTFLDAIHILMLEATSKSNWQYLDSLIRSFIDIFIHLFRDICVKLSETLIQAIDNRINFISQFKYKSSLDTLRDNYLEYQAEIKENKNKILDEMDSTNKTIVNFNQKIFTLINDNEMLIQNNKYHKKRLDSTILESIKENELKIKEYKEKIDDFTQMNKMHEADIEELNKKIIDNSNVYHEEIKRISRMQQKDVRVNRKFKLTLTSYHNEILGQIQNFNELVMKEAYTEKSLTHKIQLIEKTIIRLTAQSKEILLKHFNQHAQNSHLETKKNQEEISNEYQNEIKLFNNQYTKANRNFQKEYHMTIASYEKQINEKNLKLNETMAYYDGLLSTANQIYQNNTNEVKTRFNRTTDQFLISSYALAENNNKIINYYNEMVKEKDNEYQFKKDQSIKAISKTKNNNNEKLKKFIQQKNEEIDHLPIAFKFNSNLLNNETKKKNNQIHEDLKKAKADFNLERKRIDKEIDYLKNQLNQMKNQNDTSQRQSIAKEVKENRTALKQSLKSIKINL